MATTNKSSTKKVDKKGASSKSTAVKKETASAVPKPELPQGVNKKDEQTASSKAKVGFFSGVAGTISEYSANVANSMEMAWDTIASRAENVFRKDKSGSGQDTKSGFKTELQLAYKYTQHLSTRGIMGLPPRFTAFADVRLFEYDADANGEHTVAQVDAGDYISSQSTSARFFSGPYEGSKWIEVYLKYGNLVFFEIGRPLFLFGMGDDAREAILSLNTDNNQQISKAVVEDTSKKAKDNANMLIVFQPAGVEYAYNVKNLTDAFATFLDLQGGCIERTFNSLTYASSSRTSADGTVLPVWSMSKTTAELKGKYQVGYDHFQTFWEIQPFWEKLDKNSTAKDKNNIKGMMTKKGTFAVGGFGNYDLNAFTNDIYSDVLTSTICFYTDGGIEAPLNISHSTGPSTVLAPIVNNTVTDNLAEIQFLASDFDPTRSSAAEGNFEANNKEYGYLKKALGVITTGAKLVAPEVWKGSDSEKQVDIKIILQATSPEPQCIYREILVPYAHFLEMVSPKNVTEASTAMMNRLGAYAPPYVVRLYSRGAVNMNLALPTQISVSKNPKDLTVEGLPTRVELTLTVRDLYGMFGTPIYKATNTRMSITQCLGLTEYMSALTGVVINQEKAVILFATSAGIKDAGRWVMNVPKKWGSRVVESMFSSYNQRAKAAVATVVGKINRI